MNVYKFGGASVKDADGVKNLFKIINTQKDGQNDRCLGSVMQCVLSQNR